MMISFDKSRFETFLKHNVFAVMTIPRVCMTFAQVDSMNDFFRELKSKASEKFNYEINE